MAKTKAPEILMLSPGQLEELLADLRAQLAPATCQLLESLLRTLLWLMGEMENKETNLGRLRRIIFGPKTEKTAKLFPPSPGSSGQAGTDKPKGQGHGRKPAHAYPGAKRLPVPHPHLRPGSLCPKCLQAKLYLLKIPARLVCLLAQPIFQATLYELERLRCGRFIDGKPRPKNRNSPRPIAWLFTRPRAGRSCRSCTSG